MKDSRLLFARTFRHCWFLAVFCGAATGAEQSLFERAPAGLTGGDVLASGVNPWSYWGKYERHPRPLAQRWCDHDDIIDGWDWSLPSWVQPSPRAMLRWGMHGWRQLDRKAFPPVMAVVDELWWRWRQLEPEEGRFDFDSLRAAISERMSAGCDGVIIRLLGSVWESGTPSEWEQWRQKKQEWRFGRWSAPRWLEGLGCRKIEEVRGGQRVVHLDIFDPTYHQRYLRMVRAFGESGIPAMPEVRALIICGMSFSNGEEAAGVKLDTAEKRARWRERVQAWIAAFGGRRDKLILMGDLPGGEGSLDEALQVGSRDGFVEMYLYHTNDPVRAQFIDANGYLCVDESNPYVRQRYIFGDENEEYGERWAETESQPGRFGPLESFNYRYFTSMLRLLQMRRNYLYTETNALLPELLWYVCHELGRTTDDAPDVWSFLRESYLSPWANAKPYQHPGPVKNFERWLYQRDAPGYETEPAIRIPHALKKWWLRDEKRPYDFVARRGRRIGFRVARAVLSGAALPVAVKVTYYDGQQGGWRLHWRSGGESMTSAVIATTGRDAFRTATQFITADFDAVAPDFDIEIDTPQRTPIQFVRIIKLRR